MNKNLQSETVTHAVTVLHNEHVIAYPTEAVFGVGCDPDSETAVMRLLALKQRPVEKGLILIAASYEQLTPYIDDSRLNDKQRAAIFSCWPGPVTFVFPARATTPRWLTGRFDSWRYASAIIRWWSNCARLMANRWFQPARIYPVSRLAAPRLKFWLSLAPVSRSSMVQQVGVRIRLKFAMP